LEKLHDHTGVLRNVPVPHSVYCSSIEIKIFILKSRNIKRHTVKNNFMATTKQKTIETIQSVSTFVKGIEDQQRKSDCFGIIEIIQKETGFEPKMWGSSIIGFGSYHYTYDSGHEGDAPLVGFSPRKSEFALYIANFEGKEELLKKFGKHKTAKACVYIKKLEDVDAAVLKKLVAGSVKHYREKYK
jgi:Domain of unknown function (DU1801)